MLVELSEIAQRLLLRHCLTSSKVCARTAPKAQTVVRLFHSAPTYLWNSSLPRRLFRYRACTLCLVYSPSVRDVRLRCGWFLARRVCLALFNRFVPSSVGPSIRLSCHSSLPGCADWFVLYPFLLVLRTRRCGAHFLACFFAVHDYFLTQTRSVAAALKKKIHLHVRFSLHNTRNIFAAFLHAFVMPFAEWNNCWVFVPAELRGMQKHMDFIKAPHGWPWN